MCAMFYLSEEITTSRGGSVYTGVNTKRWGSWGAISEAAFYKELPEHLDLQNHGH